jgi:hypothetical protein
MFDIEQYEFNKGFQGYESTFALDNIDVKVTVSAEKEKDKKNLGEGLKKSIGWIFGNTEELLDFCADQLLGIKNGDWLREKENKMDRKDFKRKLKLKEIDINADGSLTLRYMDGKMFHGHDVVVEVKSDFSLDYATIEG